MQMQTLETQTDAPAPDSRSDGQLLDAFISRHDQAAFAQLMQRHGPYVFGVCRRATRKGGEQVFSSHRASTPSGGKRVHSGGQPLKTAATSGKLRLTRTGEILSYRVAEGTSDSFQELFETEFGEDDIDMVRFAADNGGSPTLVDVRIKEVSIRSDDAGAPDLLPPQPARWPLWAGLGLGAVVLGAGGYWYWSRR